MQIGMMCRPFTNLQPGRKREKRSQEEKEEEKKIKVYQSQLVAVKDRSILLMSKVKSQIMTCMTLAHSQPNEERKEKKPRAGEK